MGNQEGNDEENEEASKKQFDKLDKQFKDIAGISARMTPLLGVSAMLGDMQSRWGKQFEDINRISASMTPVLGVSAVIADMQSRWGNQFKDINRISASMTAVSGVSAVIADMQSRWGKQLEDINRISASMSPVLGVSAVIAETQNNWGKQFKGLDNSMFSALTQTLGIVGKVTQLQNNWVNQFKDIGGISALSTQALGISAMMKPYQNNWFKHFKDIDFSNVKINEDGTIDYLNETIDELNSCNSSDISWEENTVNVLQKIKTKHPVIVFLIITFLIYPIYAYYVDYAKAVINTTVQEIQGKYEMYNDKNKIIKDIKKEVIKESYINLSQDSNVKMALNEYRFVKADCLNVRISNSTNSRIIYNLKFGQSVRVLNKDRNWTLIEYTDDENICVKGWVFTRYLSTFN
ncbi:SH3 domain-containing protein [Clostridium estertheticum]|uniref:SH3 domain-containing protein n=1 Tax=Clostridium estertheticum TaxID=238834 RepID=UPI0013E8F9B4|nr:SH3 domain-containing protein [Clostridium estertheticum]MBZ9688255.1 SH3 domain-containing protein [Clostridium estertheticum]